MTQHTSLAELGMDSKMAIEIKQTLEREYDILLTAQNLRNLNFAKLAEIREKDLERKKAQIKQTDKETDEVSGIQLLIRFLSNELSTETCMELETKVDPRKIKVFLLPGIQGCGQIFNPLASKIRPIATALQYGVTNTGYMSIPEYADHLLPVCIRINEISFSISFNECFH